MAIGRPRLALNPVQLQLLEQLAARLASEDDIAGMISACPMPPVHPAP